MCCRLPIELSGHPPAHEYASRAGMRSKCRRLGTAPHHHGPAQRKLEGTCYGFVPPSGSSPVARYVNSGSEKCVACCRSQFARCANSEGTSTAKLVPSPGTISFESMRQRTFSDSSKPTSAAADMRSEKIAISLQPTIGTTPLPFPLTPELSGRAGPPEYGRAHMRSECARPHLAPPLHGPLQRKLGVATTAPSQGLARGHRSPGATCQR